MNFVKASQGTGTRTSTTSTTLPAQTYSPQHHHVVTCTCGAALPTKPVDTSRINSLPPSHFDTAPGESTASIPAKGINTPAGAAYDPRHTPPPTPQSSSSSTSPFSSPRQPKQQPILPGSISTGANNSTMNGHQRTHSRLQRRTTGSHLPSFMVSAPGKVIVYGEHAVVYGKAAIAAAISLRSYLLVTPLPRDGEKTITLRFPDIGLDHTWDINSLPWSQFNAPGKKKYYFDEVSRLDIDLVEVIKPYVSSIKGKVLQNAASCFLYLYLSLGSQHSPGAIYALRSTIPIGAGLGSSASISVCLSAALQLQHGTLTTPFEGMLESETRLQTRRINNWAFVGEMCIHGNPSGVDNTVAVQGKAVLFKRRDYSLPPEVTSLQNFPELPLMLVNTRTPRRTSEQVANVKKLLSQYEEITQLMLQAIDKITHEALDIIRAEDFDEDSSHTSLIRLGELIRINHGLLVSLGVSHPRLERIRELVDHAGIGWTKLTGAGGGGCSITLLKPTIKQAVKDHLNEKLASEGFERYDTTLGGDGVGVLWPAIVKRNVVDEASEQNREVDTDITQDLFLSAKGVEGVEGLVGVQAVGDVNGWRFWRLPDHHQLPHHEKNHL